MDKKVGFIGLGIMGKPMSVNLIKAGYSLVVYDLNTNSMDELSRLGATKASSPAEVASQTTTLITMLPNGPEVVEVVTGEKGILKNLSQGGIIIDMSSIAPDISKQMYDVCKKQGIQFIDAPVSGGEPKAIDGTLAVMVGCEEAIFEVVYPLLKCMADSVIRTGTIGSGNTTKLANQIVVALNIAAISEAYVLATKAGVDPELVFNAIKGGLAGSTVMNAKSPMILDRNFKPGFKIRLHIKDLANALETGHQIGAPLPLTAMVMEMFQTLKAYGNEENDHCNLVQYFEHIAGVSVKKSNGGNQK